MARIAGVDIPRDKRIEIALTYIFGIGPTTAKRLLSLAYTLGSSDDALEALAGLVLVQTP